MVAYGYDVSHHRQSSHRRSRRERRSRAVRLLMFMLLLVSALVFVPRVALSMTRSEAPVMRSYTVQPGDTLWSVAVQFNNGQDPRRAISDLKAANHLSGATIQPGQDLLIPAAWGK